MSGGSCATEGEDSAHCHIGARHDVDAYESRRASGPQDLRPDFQFATRRADQAKLCREKRRQIANGTLRGLHCECTNEAAEQCAALIPAFSGLNRKAGTRFLHGRNGLRKRGQCWFHVSNHFAWLWMSKRDRKECYHGEQGSGRHDRG